ncbi:MAG: ribosome maturation factor RimP [Gammaproteobacteria bacterium]|nr:ribosome maturation factor RimP [Gammaproteobacteria bacterium]
MGQANAQLQAIIEPAVTALGFELVGIEYQPQGRHSVLRIYIDHEDGIDVEDCAEVSRQVSAVLDVEDPIKGEYSLEVSSPGIDRPLFTAEHYERYSGALAEIRLRSPLEGRRKFKGRMHGIKDDAVVIEVDGVEYTLPLDNIEKANLIHEW